MNPARERYYRNLFMIAAAYDGLLGVLFLFFPERAYNSLGISEKLPEFGGYIALLGAFIFVIGFAYLLISRGDLRQNLDLILVGIVYKLSYCVIAIIFAFSEQLPHWLFSVIFGGLDFTFFVLMTECYLYLRKNPDSKVY